ncbi:MAG: hypothetical protein WCK33_00050 [Phycisphaerae bacterium]
MQGNITRSIATLMLAVAASEAHAGIANGGFESGFAGWSYVGNGGSSSTGSLIARDPIHMGQQEPLSGQWGPTEGDRFAALWSTDSFDRQGATLSQRFAANPGEVLEFMIFYDFGDFAPSTDGAFARLDDGQGSAELVRFNMDAASMLDDDTNVGWHRISHVLPASSSGFYELTFSITDTDGTFESILGIDDVRVIPAPGAMGLLALAGLCGRRRR